MTCVIIGYGFGVGVGSTGLIIGSTGLIIGSTGLITGGVGSSGVLIVVTEVVVVEVCSIFNCS